MLTHYSEGVASSRRNYQNFRMVLGLEVACETMFRTLLLASFLLVLSFVPTTSLDQPEQSVLINARPRIADLRASLICTDRFQ